MEKPILFNTEMVKAILEGRKTTTRRIIKNIENRELLEHECEYYKFGYSSKAVIGTIYSAIHWRKPKLNIGDILYVRETWAVCHSLDLCSPNGCNIEHQLKENLVWYRADGEQENTATKVGEHLIGRGRWRPSIHMPKEAARIFLKVTDVRVERLQDITEDQIKREGIKEEFPPIAQDEFVELWNGTLKKEQLKMYGWDANPYVWVIEFEREVRNNE